MPDAEPYAALYVQHRRAALAAARALVPADVAEDVVAEAFTRVLAAVRNGGGPAGTFRPYLMAAVRNIARDYCKAQGKTGPFPADPRATAVPSAGDLAALAEERHMMARAYSSLRPRWRAVLWQTEVERRPVADLASAAGMSPAAVSQLASRARIGLAVAWQRERGEQERITGPLPALRILAERKRVHR